MLKVRYGYSSISSLASLTAVSVIRTRAEDSRQLRTMLTDLQRPLVDMRAELTKLSTVNDSESSLSTYLKYWLTLSLPGESKMKMLAWISTMRYSEHHDHTRKHRLKDSGMWFISHPSYVQWRQSTTSCVLWVHGIRKSSTPRSESGMTCPVSSPPFR